MKLSRPRNLAAYLVTAGLVALPIYPALWLAATNWGQKLEKSLIDLRYMLSGPQKLSSHIVLVLEDGESKKRFGHLESSRGVIAALINQARAKGAKVIAIDFQFLRPNLAHEDSLLLAAIKNGDEIIVGCSYDVIALPKPQERSTLNDVVQEESVARYPHFLVSPDSMEIMPPLLAAGAKPAFVDVVFDSINGQANMVPLYLRAGKLVAAFSLETVKSFFDISDAEIKVRGNELVLPIGYKSLQIPIMRTGEFLINHLGQEDDFDYFSWAEVYDWFTGLRPDSTLNWKGKIVLIGSKLDDADFPTPYATDFFLPGALIHATVIDNILTGKFLRSLPPQTTLYLILAFALVLVVLFTKLRPTGQILAVASLLVLFSATTFIFFHHYRLVLPVAPVLFFIAASAAMHSLKEWLVTAKAKTQLEKIQTQLEQEITQLISARAQRQTAITNFVLFIFSLQRRDESFFTHYLLKLQEDTFRQPFWLKPKPPWVISNHVVNKLDLGITHLGKNYAEYLRQRTPTQISPKAQLRKIGSRLYEEFGLRQTFHELFAGGGATAPLQLVVNNLKIPWPWAYDAAADKFLCEEFALGISFAHERQNEGRYLPHGHKEERAALLFYGDWQGHPDKELQHVRQQVYAIEKTFDGQACNTAIIHQKTGDFLDRLKVMTEDNNLRIIHYTGHAKDGLWDVGPKDELTADIIFETGELSFPSRPLVFLNACGSGRLSEHWDKMDHFSTGFLACGAGACIVTSFDVYEKTACTFSLQFYDYFVKERKTAGEALKLTIQKLGEPDPRHGYDPEYDMTRYFYQLFGDPALRF